MRKTKINWYLAQQDYLSIRELSLTDIANRYDVSLSMVKKVSMKGNWSALRDHIWSKAQQEVLDESTFSVKATILRRLRTAQWLQRVGLEAMRYQIETNGFSKIGMRTILRLILLGLKVERQLYPKDISYAFKDKLNYSINDVPIEFIEAIKEVYVKHPEMFHRFLI